MTKKKMTEEEIREDERQMMRDREAEMAADHIRCDCGEWMFWHNGFWHCSKCSRKI